MNHKSLSIILLMLIFSSCSSKGQQTEKKPSTSVEVREATCQDIHAYIETVGHMEAFQTVAIKAQVEGYLEKLLFNDGDDVCEGDLLYVIDQRPYIEEVNKTEGAYQENLAQLQYAKDSLIRNSELVKQNYISENSYEKFISDTMSAEGLVKQSKAAFEQAKINLGFTEIYAPISGRIGFTQVFKGDLITDSSTMLDLNQISPIYATFFLPGSDLPTVQKYQGQKGALDVIITPDSKEKPKTSYEGLLTFINNKIDLATGMVQMKATYVNEEKTLWPNQYVSIKVLLYPIKDAVLIPLSCIETTPKGDRVYVVNDSSEIELRAVTTGQLQKGNMIHIKEGVKPGELVVTSGQLMLYPGLSVNAKRAKSVSNKKEGTL